MIYILDKTEKNKKSNRKLVLLLKKNVKKLPLTITLHFFIIIKKESRFIIFFRPYSEQPKQAG